MSETTERWENLGAGPSLADERDKLRALLKECSDELAEWVEHHYALVKIYPSELRRYTRDIDPVLRARAALQTPAHHPEVQQ